MFSEESQKHPKRAKEIRSDIFPFSAHHRGIKQGCGLTPPMYIGFDIDIF